RSYAPFEADMRAGTAAVYHHEMPGGQVTNLREQARSLGLEARWPEVAAAYAQVNLLFGDIVKVTPTSKVVGDMALFMVSNDLTPAQVADPQRAIDFPDSVVSLFKGELGYPAHGFPEALQRKVLKGEAALTQRAGALLPAVDLAAEQQSLAASLGRDCSEQELASHLMYPKVFKDFAAHSARFGDVSILPTSAFFYGLKEGEEVCIELERGKTLIVQLLGRADTDDGHVKLFFELNGQARVIKVAKAGAAAASSQPKAEEDNPHHVGAPMPGMVSTVLVAPGQRVQQGDTLLTIEAMKMEVAIKAERDGVIQQVLVASGKRIANKDLLLTFQ
ncbi:biotin/lipoyl-containing protein, partial [Vogesella facilis]